MESCPAQAVLPLVGLAADKITRDRYTRLFCWALMMGLPVLCAAWPESQLWFAIPLIVSISLVYGATRHEHLVPILYHAWRTARWILSFMGIIVVVLSIFAWFC